MNYFKYFALIILGACAQIAAAQYPCSLSSSQPGYQGPVNSGVLLASCTGSTTPAPPPPPPPPTNGQCSPSQTAVIAGKTLQRQCSGQVLMLPSDISYVGPLTDLGTILGGKPYPSYLYSGKTPTYQINTGSYIAMAFVPNATGAMQMVANPSYGDGGTISVSLNPGGMTRGGPGVVCALAYGASNSVYVSTTAQVCPVVAGRTYYINMADVDINGTPFCYGGAATCAYSYLAYTLYMGGH